MNNKSKKTKSKNKSKYELSFLKSNKLINLYKLKILYKKTLKYLKNIDDEVFFKLKDDIFKRNVDSNKTQILRNILLSFNKKAPFDYIPKINTEFNLKSENNCFKDYKKIKTLGQGNYGTTYLVEKGGKEYALKEQKIVTSTWKPNKEDQLKLVKNEIIISKKMGDLGISPKIYDYYTCYENSILQVYILMEYMNYGTLKEWILKNNFTNSNKNDILKKINQLHKHGIVHNDLHLENILVTEINGKPEFYIADFGLGLTLESIKKKDYRKDIDTFTNQIIFLEENKYVDIISRLFVINGLI
jgi:tRNA A-37 threonylcarbamoyl transferase component Bud32